MILLESGEQRYLKATPNNNKGIVGLNKILFIHRNHKLNKQVQETQKQYAYLSVTYKGIVQELCGSRGGRPGLSVLTSLLVSVDVKIY